MSEQPEQVVVSSDAPAAPPVKSTKKSKTIAPKAKPTKTEFSGRIGAISLVDGDSACTFKLKGKKSAAKLFDLGRPDGRMFVPMLSLLVQAQAAKSKVHVKTAIDEANKVIALSIHSK